MIGANGSGKSTLAKVITGLYELDGRQDGGIFVDNQLVNADNYSQYRQLFSAIYSDFYFFLNLQSNRKIGRAHV